MTETQQILIVNIAYCLGEGREIKGKAVEALANKAKCSARTVYRAMSLVQNTSIIRIK